MRRHFILTTWLSVLTTGRLFWQPVLTTKYVFWQCDSCQNAVLTDKLHVTKCSDNWYTYHNVVLTTGILIRMLFWQQDNLSEHCSDAGRKCSDNSVAASEQPIFVSEQAHIYVRTGLKQVVRTNIKFWLQVRIILSEQVFSMSEQVTYNKNEIIENTHRHSKYSETGIPKIHIIMAYFLLFFFW